MTPRILIKVTLLVPVADGCDANDCLFLRMTTISLVLLTFMNKFLLLAQEEIFWSSFCAVGDSRDGPLQTFRWRRRSYLYSTTKFHKCFLNILGFFSVYLTSNTPLNRNQSGVDNQPKPSSLPCTLNLFLPSLIKKSRVCASSIFLQPSTPSTVTYYSKHSTVCLVQFNWHFSPLASIATNILPILRTHQNLTSCYLTTTLPVAETWRRVGGDGKIFAHLNVHFHAENFC